MTKGLPASGKSTWAKHQVHKAGGKIKRVNKDDLRAMLDDGKWSKSNETMIVAARDQLISLYLGDGFDVIVDDTNLAPKHQTALENIARDFGAEFVIEDFTDVPLETCLERDAKRANYVGEKVIKTMYNSFLKKKPDVVKYNPDLPNAIICDIDGTLAHMAGRSPYEWKRVGEDTVDEAVKALLLKHATHDPMEELPENYIVLLSGRDEVCRPETEKWLRENKIPYNELYMRPEGDTRKDSIVKQELFDENIKNRYNVTFILDDRNQVVEMWRDMGLKVLQVAEGDF